MTVIGLTGGIAAGKSTATEVLLEMGAAIIDADRLGHRSYEPGTPGFQKVVNAFGHDIVGKDGVVDRRILGGKVFGAPEQIERLNNIVWPEIRALIKDEIKQIRSQDKDAIIVLEAAVLLEAKWQDLCDEIWVITTPVKLAVARLRARNGLSEDAAMARINSQMTNMERAELADIKIENSGPEEQLRSRIERAWGALESRLGRKRTVRKKPVAPASKTAPKKGAASKSAPAKAAAKSSTAKSATTKSTAAKPASMAAPAKPAAKAAAKISAKKPATVTTKAAPARAATKPAAKPAAKPATTKKTSAAASRSSSKNGSGRTSTATTKTRAGARSK